MIELGKRIFDSNYFFTLNLRATFLCEMKLLINAIV